MEGLKKSVDHGGEKVEIDLAQPITKASLGADPGKFLPVAIEGIRQVAVDALAGAQKTEGERNEIVARLTTDVATVLDEHKKLVEALRDHKRDVPDPTSPSDKITLRGAQLSRKIGAFSDLEIKEGFQRVLGGMSQSFYNLLCYTPQELGITDKQTADQLRRMHVLHNSLVWRIQFLGKTNPALLVGGWRQLEGAEEYLELVKKFGSAAQEARLTAAAMNETNATEGGNWVPPAILSPVILPYVELDFALVSAFPSFPMSNLTHRVPVLDSRMKSKKMAENVDRDGAASNATIVPQYWNTGKVDLTAKLHGVGIVDTPSWEEDWIGTSEWINRGEIMAIYRGREDWFVNGQLSAQIDTAETIAATDARNMGDGLRYWYKAGKDAGIVSDIDASAGLTAELLAKAIGQGGAFSFLPSRCIWLTSTAGFAQLLVLKTQQGSNVVLTDSELGAQATFRTGALGKAFGRDILVCNEISEQMTVGGLVDTVTPGNRTIVMHVSTEHYIHGERRGILAEFSTDARFFEHQHCYKATAREDFQAARTTSTFPAIQQIVGVTKF